MKRLMIPSALLLASVLVSACSRAAPSAPPGETKTPAPVRVGESANWEQQWDKSVEDAKKEGKVTVYAAWVPEVRMAVSAIFKNKYGVEVEFFPLSRGAELFAKVQAERRAGLAVADVLSSGATTIITALKPQGLLTPIEPSLILPEVRNPQVWQGGRFPFVDKDHMGINMLAEMQRMVVRNIDMIKEGEITTYKDILKPQFKGRITLNDPTVTGIGNSIMTHFVVDLWNLDEATAYFRQLMKQDPVITRDSLLHVETVARGKYALALGARADIAADFMEKGAPIAFVITKEGTRVASGVYSLSLPNVSPHPAATTVFINWLLSKEGQTVLSNSSHAPSMRLDVPTEGISPDKLPLPGEKLYPDSEEWQLTAVKMLDVARKIIEESK